MYFHKRTLSLSVRKITFLNFLVTLIFLTVISDDLVLVPSTCSRKISPIENSVYVCVSQYSTYLVHHSYPVFINLTVLT